VEVVELDQAVFVTAGVEALAVLLVTEDPYEELTALLEDAAVVVAPAWLLEVEVAVDVAAVEEVVVAEQYIPAVYESTRSATQVAASPDQ
jgi:hypothetical protein